MLFNTLAENDQSLTLIALWNGKEGDDAVLHPELDAEHAGAHRGTSYAMWPLRVGHSGISGRDEAAAEVAERETGPYRLFLRRCRFGAPPTDGRTDDRECGGDFANYAPVFVVCCQSYTRPSVRPLRAKKRSPAGRDVNDDGSSATHEAQCGDIRECADHTMPFAWRSYSRLCGSPLIGTYAPVALAC